MLLGSSEYEAANEIHIGTGDINLFKTFDTGNCMKARRLNFNMKMDEANTELLQLFEYIKIKCWVEITASKPSKLPDLHLISARFKLRTRCRLFSVVFLSLYRKNRHEASNFDTITFFYLIYSSLFTYLTIRPYIICESDSVI